MIVRIKYILLLVLVYTLTSCSDLPDNIKFTEFDVKTLGYIGSIALVGKLPNGFHSVKDFSPTEIAYNITISGDGDNNCIVASFDLDGKPILGAPLSGNTYLAVRKKGNEVIAVACKKTASSHKYKVALETTFKLDNKVYKYSTYTKIRTPAEKS